MCYALIKFNVYLLGEKMFSAFTDCASLRTAVKTIHLSSVWLVYFYTSQSIIAWGFKARQE